MVAQACRLVGALILATAGSCLAARPAGAEGTAPPRADFDTARPVGFRAQVEPTLGRLGCNAGACHGRSGGQKGFALSLFGADPSADRRALTSRIDPDDPESSLLLRKATGQEPHGGGTRLVPGSPEHAALLRWIGQGDDPDRPPAEALLTGLDVEPGTLTLAPGGANSVRVVAHWADGSSVDVTRLVRFESGSPGFVAVDSTGSARAGTRIGVGFLLARLGPDVATARVVVTSGSRVANPVAAGTSILDRLVLRQLDELGVRAGPPSTEAEFARRSSLDLTGRLPDPAEVARFEADTAPGQRERWVDRLLKRPEHADYFALKWSSLLRNRRTLGDPSKPSTFRFHSWVREAIAANLPMDQFAGAIVAGQGVAARAPAVEWYRLVADRDQRAEDVAQVFLGARIGCARCHRHPTERWFQADHADFARFFDRVEVKHPRDPDAFRVFHRANDPPGAAPRVLGGVAPVDLAPGADPRAALVAWMAEPRRSPMARSVANRTWKHFFGQGLVEPEDDLRPTNPASNPALLDALAADFAASGFDYRRLIRAIATSDAYARSSRPGAEGDPLAVAPNLSARFEPRPLPAEVLLDAIGDVAGAPSRFAGVPHRTRAVALPDDGFPSGFLDAFGRPARRTACECERAAEPDLAQALFLLNSTEVEGRLADPNGRAARYAGPGDMRPDAAKVEELYRVALSRPPEPEEMARCRIHLNARRAAGRLAEGWQDLIWAIVNTGEFLSNY